VLASLAICEGIKDRGKDVVGPGEHVIIPEAHHPISAALEPFSACGVPLVILPMLPTIHLDDEPRLGTKEIDNVRADGLLTTKAKPIDFLSAQTRP
jgi:hypothetical protein